MPSLKRQNDFQELRDNGQFHHVTHWLAVSYKDNKSDSMRWAWTISKKVGNAVTRNRLRRWGKEYLRGSKSRNIDVNFIFKNKGKEFYKRLSHQEFDQAFEKVFSKRFQ